MTDLPPTPPKAPRPRDASGRPTIANADVPSETAGLPGVGEGAAAQGYARDLVGHQANEAEGPHGDGPGGEGEGRDQGAANARAREVRRP